MGCCQTKYLHVYTDGSVKTSLCQYLHLMYVYLSCMCVRTYITSITSITRKLSVLILLDVEIHGTINTHPHMYIFVKLTIYNKTSKPLVKNAHSCEFNSSLLLSYFDGCGGGKLQEVTLTTNVLYNLT